MSESRMGVLVLGFLGGVAMLCLCILAALHDGSLATEAAALYTTILQTAMGGIAALLSVTQVVSGWVNVKQTQASAAAATSAPVAVPVAPVPAGALPTEG